MRFRRSIGILVASGVLWAMGTPPVPGEPSVEGGVPPDCTVVGTAGDDVLIGTAGPDVICGLAGDDVLQGLEGDDILDGGPGHDTLEGGEGVDRARFSGPQGVRVDLVAGTSSGQGLDTLIGIEDVSGSPDDDVLKGNGAPNTLLGHGGTDLLLGAGGSDALFGGGGGDYLNGGLDGAHLQGGTGADACLRGVATSCYLPRIQDGNDTKGTMDVKRVRSRAGQSPPRWKVVTFSKWTLKGIWDNGYTIVWIDTAGDPDPEYHVLAYSNGNRMRGGLYRENADGGETRIGSAKVTKNGARGATVRLPLGKVDRSRPYFRWSVQTLFTGDSCRKVCFDRIPGKTPLPQAVLSEL